MDAQDKYILNHTTAEPDALQWLRKQTHIRTNHPRMLSGPLQGRILTMLAELSGAKRILEIGTFTGYSAICLASGLPEDGHLDTLEINDELEELIIEGFERAGLASKITLHIGDALQILEKLKAGEPYDMVFIDANKRQYEEYYRLVFDMVRPGGLILADNVLWDGKVYADPVPTDEQTRHIAGFNDIVAGDSRVEATILPLRDGLYLIRKLI